MNRIVLGLGTSAIVALAVACGGSSAIGPGTDGGADTGSTSDAGGASDADAAVGLDATATADGAADAGARDDASPDAATIEDAASTSPNVGADAGPLPDGSPPCTATPGQNTVFMYGMDGVAIGADGGATTVTVPDGFPFAAHISLAAPFAGSASETDLVTVNDPALGMSASAGAPKGTATAPISLAAGARVVKYAVQESFGGEKMATRYAYQVVDVCGETIADAVLPGFPALTAVNVEVDGLDRLQTYPDTALTLTLWTPDLTFAATNTVPFPDAGTSVVVPLMAPTGVPLLPRFVGTTNYPVSGAQVTLTGDAQISVPGLVTISGTIASPDTSALGAGFLQCTAGPTATEASPYVLSDVFAAHVTGGAPYSYSVGISQGATCTLAPLIDLNVQLGPPFSVSYLKTTTPITASAAATQDYTFPSAGTLAPFAMTIVDARGKPLKNVNTNMRATSLSASALAGYEFGVSTSSGALNTVTPLVVPGTYSIQVQTYE